MNGTLLDSGNNKYIIYNQPRGEHKAIFVIFEKSHSLGVYRHVYGHPQLQTMQ